jgi:hypothetical protein
MLLLEASKALHPLVRWGWGNLQIEESPLRRNYQGLGQFDVRDPQLVSAAMAP